MAELSKSQVDRLGERLREGSHTESDIQILDEYRRSFGEAYESVLQTIRNRSQFPTGRIAKSTKSIIEKLIRIKKLRLSRMQDVAGCRVVVPNIIEQNQLVAILMGDFPEILVVDRRIKPSHGYRAVHLVIDVSGKHVEIQVRSLFQHLWAEMSEKASDVLDPTIKYGGGPKYWRSVLDLSSDLVGAHEEFEIASANRESALHRLIEANKNLHTATASLLELSPPANVVLAIKKKLEKSVNEIRLAELEIEKEKTKITSSRAELAKLLNDAMARLDAFTERTDDLPD